MTEQQITEALFQCAKNAGNSEHKRAYLIQLPNIIFALSGAIYHGYYQPQPFTVFAVTDPKLREIFAPAFADRLAQQWLINQIEPWYDKRFIDDNFANRKNKGTQAAINRLQQFMRQPAHDWYCKLDIRAFFPSIHRPTLIALWHKNQSKIPTDPETRRQLNQVATAILTQSPIEPTPTFSGDLRLLQKVPPNKSLYHAKEGHGLPIGSLSSQFFANVYLNELDQYIKHTLKIKGYVRYVDDFVILADNPKTLMQHKESISRFLQTHLKLQLHPHKIVLQKTTQGIDFLGSVIYPRHTLMRQRCIRALRRRIAWFKYLTNPQTERKVPPPQGNWQRWLQNHAALTAPGIPSQALLQRMLATLNSYYGLFQHADTYRLRKHIYQQELGPLKKYFLPDSAAYNSLRIKKIWLTF